MMRELITDPGSGAQWRTLVGQAEVHNGCVLGRRLEDYLVNLLIRVSTHEALIEGLLSLDQLTCHPSHRRQAERLRDIGDQCLLFAGLYPELAGQRGVRLGQFVSLGRTAYSQLHELQPGEPGSPYADLSLAFTTLLDLLHTMRELRDGAAGLLTPLQAFELWTDTGSLRALSRIRACTGAFPVRLPHDTAALPM